MVKRKKNKNGRKKGAPRNSDGTFKEGNKMREKEIISSWSDKILEHKTNEIKSIVSAKGLSLLDRGMIYSDFKEKSGLTDSAMGKLFGKARSTISREIVLYIKAKEYGISMENYPDVPARVVARALESKTKEDAELVIKAYKKFPQIDVNAIASVINKLNNVKDIKEKLKKKYEQKIENLTAFEKWLDYFPDWKKR